MRVMIIKFRRPLIVGFHIVLIVLANYLAFWIRFDGVIPDEELALMIKMIPWLILIRGADVCSASALQRAMALHGDLGSA